MLPHDAFEPRYALSNADRSAFITRRNQLFSLCLNEEQAYLLELARWYEAHNPRCLPRPNVLSMAQEVVVDFKVLGWQAVLPGSKMRRPGALVRALAWIGDGVSAVEDWRARRVRRAMCRKLEGLRNQGRADVLFTVLYFLRGGGFSMGNTLTDETRPLLDTLATACVDDARTPVLRRFNAVRRCASWPEETLASFSRPEELDRQLWQMLHELIASDVEVALQFIDGQLVRREAPRLLWHHGLSNVPDLACSLALQLRPHRPDLAAELLCNSIAESERLFERMSADEPGREALADVIQASCDQLAIWLGAEPRLGSEAARQAVLGLWRYGEPSAVYWASLPQRALALHDSAPQADSAASDHLLGVIAFHAPTGQPLSTQVLQRFETLVRKCLADPRQPKVQRLDQLLSSSLRLLEEITISGRNRRVAARSDHPLLAVVDEAIDDFMVRLSQEQPQSLLHRRVAWVRILGHGGLVRKHHALLRAEFASLASQFPAEAGIALRRVASYRHYSQTDDQVFRRDLCIETFEMLLPVLADISEAHAAVAREGLRNPGFGVGDWMDDFC